MKRNNYITCTRVDIKTTRFTLNRQYPIVNEKQNGKWSIIDILDDAGREIQLIFGTSESMPHRQYSDYVLGSKSGTMLCDYAIFLRSSSFEKSPL